MTPTAEAALRSEVTAPESTGDADTYARALIENSFDLILLVDRDGRILYASPSTQRILGYGPQEVAGTSAFDYIHPDDVPRSLDFYYDRSVREALSHFISFRVRHRDGSWRHFEATGANLLRDPNVRGIVVNARDITERKRLEETLRSSEEYYRTLTEDTYDLIAVLDGGGTLRYISPSVRRIAGYDPEELLGKNAAEFMHPDDVPDILRDYPQGTGERGQVRHFTYRLRHKDGSWHLHEAVAKDAMANPAIAGIVLHSNDITERQRLEEELQRSEEYFRSLIEKSSDVIAVLDRQGTIKYASPSVERAGYRVEEVVGRSILSFAHPDDLGSGSAAIASILRSPGSTRTMELRILHSDGFWHYYEASVANMLETPGVEGVIIHARDITERREAERFSRIQRDLAVALSGAITLEHALEIALGGILAATGLDSGAVFLLDEESGQLNLAHHTGYSDRFVEGILSRAWVPSHAALLADGRPAYSSYGEAAAMMPDAIREEGLKAEAMVPILYEGEVVGCLDLSSHNLEEIPPRSRDAIEILAGQLSQAIMHARLLSALRKSEERYRIIYDYTGDPIYTYDTSLTLIRVNKKACELIGYEEEEILGKNILELGILHPDDFERAARDVQKLFAGELVNDELRFIRKDGSVAIGEVTGSPLYDGEGNIVAFTNVARDITEKKAAEAARRESEEKYRLIYENAQEAIFTYDRKLRMMGMNPKACELSGYREEEVLGKNIFELGILHPDDVERASGAWDSLLAGEVVKQELRFVTKGGSTIITEVTSGSVRDEEGRVLAITNVVRDITEQKRDEARMEKLSRCLLGLGPDPLENIMSIVRAGGEILGTLELRYGRLDKGRLSVFLPREGSGEFAPPACPEDYVCHSVIASGGDSPILIEDIAASDLAEEAGLEACAFDSFLGYPVRLRGKTVGSLCLFGKGWGCFSPSDVNYLGMLARALTIEEERLAHEESIRHFVDIASHELRTPLSIIKGYADAFQFGDLMDLNEFQLDKIRIINTKADKMAKTINDLLDLSRIERGHFAMDKRPVDIASLVKGAVRQMREKGVDRSIEIRVSDGVKDARADAEKLTDLLTILLDNAAHYSPASSAVEIEVEPLGAGVLISVMDRGPGIPEPESEMVFERFYQLEDSRHHSASGMGLGLYIAREIAEGHGGRIWHENREGGGSVFRVILP